MMRSGCQSVEARAKAQSPRVSHLNFIAPQLFLSLVESPLSAFLFLTSASPIPNPAPHPCLPHPTRAICGPACIIQRARLRFPRNTMANEEQRRAFASYMGKADTSAGQQTAQYPGAYANPTGNPYLYQV